MKYLQSISQYKKIKRKLQESGLIKVCAWCPKGSYPRLKHGETYTHGLCRKHYRQISNRKNLAISLLLIELIDHTVTYSNKYMKRLKSAVKIAR